NLSRLPSTPTPLLTRGRSIAAADNQELPTPPVTTAPGDSAALPLPPATPTTPTPTTANSGPSPIRRQVPPLNSDDSDSDTATATATFAYRRRTQQSSTANRIADRTKMGNSTVATITVHKLKDCPTLEAGTITPQVLQNWYHACRRFSKQSGKDPKTEVVPLAADAMLEPRLQAWYYADMARIDKLTLDEYIAELSALVLDKNWAHQIRQQILSAKQPEATRFVDWRIEIENLNSLLTTSAKRYALTTTALRDLLEANTRNALCLSLSNKPIDADAEYKAWCDEVHERDQDLRDEEKRFEAKLVDMRNANRERKSLLQRLSDTKPNTSTSTSTRQNTATPAAARPTTGLPKLTDEDRKLLNDHDGCTRCRQFYIGHRAVECPMTKSNTWPDATTYRTLTSTMALAAKPASRLAVGFVPTADDDDDEDYNFYDSNTYAIPSDDPFTMPHIYISVEVSGPSISEFPISIKALPDVGCPSTVISGQLASELGLRRFPLPKREDNLSSLSGTPLSSSDYVKLDRKFCS
ncbi:hypothetical protein BDZ97DRAFT_1758710, partial [Flammula alnicola]